MLLAGCDAGQPSSGSPGDRPAPSGGKADELDTDGATDTDLSFDTDGASTGGEASEGTDGGTQPFNCETICSDTPPDSCFFGSSCYYYCQQNSATWTDPAKAAFDECVRSRSLCDQWINECLWDVLYPDAFQHKAVVNVDGLASFEGATTYFRVSFPDDSDTGFGVAFIEAAVEFGRAVASTPIVGRIDGTAVPRVGIYIDVDGDAACTPGTDLTYESELYYSGTWDAPILQGWIWGGSLPIADTAMCETVTAVPG
jgi:hypothetical protein